MSDAKHTPGVMLVDDATIYVLSDDPDERDRVNRLSGLVYAHGSGGAKPGESQASARRLALAWNNLDSLLAALRRADQFITNGIELGFIHLPESGDPARHTPGVIKAAIRKATTGATP